MPDGCRPPRSRHPIIKLERLAFQIEEAAPIAGPPAITPPHFPRSHALAGGQGRRNSNCEIVAIDPIWPVIFRDGVAPAPRLAGLVPTADSDIDRAGASGGDHGRPRTPSKTPPRAGGGVHSRLRCAEYARGRQASGLRARTHRLPRRADRAKILPESPPLSSPFYPRREAQHEGRATFLAEHAHRKMAAVRRKLLGRFACPRSSLHRRRLGESAFERLVCFLGEIDVKFAELGRLGDEILV